MKIDKITYTYTINASTNKVVNVTFDKGTVKGSWVNYVAGSRDNTSADAQFINDKTLIVYNKHASTAQDITVNVCIIYI